MSAARPTSILARHVVADHGDLGPCRITIDDGRVIALEPPTGPVPDVIVAPGSVDLQVNGIDDVDCATADGPDWERLDRQLVRTGVTAWLPTLVSAPFDRYPAALARIAAAQARSDAGHVAPSILGAHLEGPFLGSQTGAHRPDAVVPVDAAFIAALDPVVTLMTLGPDAGGALTAVASLRARRITVSLGHSAASAATTRAAVAAGATMVTHLFNAMGPLHHRDPGLAAVALTDERLVAGLIADLVHIDATMLRLAYAAKGPRGIALVTDSVAWRAPRLAGRIAVVDGAPRLADGTIAGSVLTMDAAIRNVVDAAGITPLAALRSATATPAAAIGAAAHGRLRIGGRADLVQYGADDLRVRATMIGGQIVHES